jgi:hypothetical protein
MNYVGLKYMDREGDILEVYGYDKETNEYLIRGENNINNMFADYILTVQELEEETSTKTQRIRRKFYKGCVTLN